MYLYYRTRHQTAQIGPAGEPWHLRPIHEKAQQTTEPSCDGPEVAEGSKGGCSELGRTSPK